MTGGISHGLLCCHYDCPELAIAIVLYLHAVTTATCFIVIYLLLLALAAVAAAYHQPTTSTQKIAVIASYMPPAVAGLIAAS